MGRDRSPPASLLFSHSQNCPVVFRVIMAWALLKAMFCVEGPWAWLHTDGRGGKFQNGTELLSWARADHHPHGTTWPNPGPHSDCSDQAKGGASSAGTCPTPALILEPSTAWDCPSWAGHQEPSTVPWEIPLDLLCVCADALSPTAGGTELPGALALRHRKESKAKVREAWCCLQSLHKPRSEGSLSPHIWLTHLAWCSQQPGEPADICS